MAQRRKKDGLLKASGNQVHWLTWVLAVGVGLSFLGVTGVHLISSELTKTVVLWWVVLFGWVVWWCLVIQRGAVDWKWRMTDLAILAWWAVNILATWNSELPLVSLWGFGDSYSEGMIALTGYVLLYFLLRSLPGLFSAKLWMWVVASLGFVGSLSVVLSVAFPESTFSLLARLSSQTGVFLALTLPVFLSLRLVSVRAIERWVSTVLLALTLTALILLDQTVAWWMCLGCLAVWTIGQGWFQPKQLVMRVLVVASCMTIAILGLFLEVNIFQPDIFLSPFNTWQLILQQLQHPVLGVGQQNFVFLSAAEQPQADTFITFASSSVFGWLASLGVLGAITWLSLVICVIWSLWLEWKKKAPTPEEWGIGVAWCGAIMASFLLPVGFSILLLVWLLMGVSHSARHQSRSWSMAKHSWLKTCALLGAMLSVCLFVVSLWFGGKQVIAQWNFWTAQEEYAYDQTSPIVETHLRLAQQLAPDQADYNFALAEFLIIQGQGTPQSDLEFITELVEQGLAQAPYQTYWQQVLNQLQQPFIPPPVQ